MLVQMTDSVEDSDNEIVLLLKNQGINIARRTVAKYREILNIAPTNLRKIL